MQHSMLALRVPIGFHAALPELLAQRQHSRRWLGFLLHFMLLYLQLLAQMQHSMLALQLPIGFHAALPAAACSEAAF